MSMTAAGVSVSVPASRRVTQKELTRARIAATAERLFRTQGYETTTVDDIATAAAVSRKTVFNYFPSKEDLVFDRAAQREAAVTAAVVARPAGTSVLESFRALCLRQVEQLERLRQNTGQGSGGFFDLVAANPALQRRWDEVTTQLMDTLADALAREAGASPDDPVVRTVAWSLMGAQRSLFRRLRQRASSGAGTAWIVRAHRRDVHRVFDQLRDGLATYPTAEPRRPENS